MDDRENIQILIEEKLILAQNLIDKLARDYSKIDGGIKTKRLVEKEMKFLQKLKTDDDIEAVRRKVQCTNLNFYNHLVESLDYYSKNHKITGIAQVQRRSFEDKAIRCDIVCSDQSAENLWIKIIARNSESLIDEVMGRCEYGSRDILEVAEEFVETAQDAFRPRKVIFDFLNPIDSFLEDELEDKGVILGRKYRACENTINENQTGKILNIDVSTMLAYISELSNGGVNYKFNEQLLEEQAVIERREPIMPVLNQIFAGNKLIACETAVRSFEEIIKLLAGPNEMRRAEELKSRLEIYPDIAHPEEIIDLELSSQIKERSRKIIAFGISHNAITVSSNSGFKRAARMQNMDIPMIVIGARALSEQKQQEKIDC